MKTKDYSDCPIQFAFGRITSPDDIREIWWRICPSELSLWDRLFHNPWRQFYKECYGDLLRYFNPTEWREEISQLKTYKDAIEYQSKQYELNDDYRRKQIDDGVIWPDA